MRAFFLCQLQAVCERRKSDVGGVASSVDCPRDEACHDVTWTQSQHLDRPHPVAVARTTTVHITRSVTAGSICVPTPKPNRAPPINLCLPKSWKVFFSGSWRLSSIILHSYCVVEEHKTMSNRNSKSTSRCTHLTNTVQNATEHIKLHSLMFCRDIHRRVC